MKTRILAAAFALALAPAAAAAQAVGNGYILGGGGGSSGGASGPTIPIVQTNYGFLSGSPTVTWASTPKAGDALFVAIAYSSYSSNTFTITTSGWTKAVDSTSGTGPGVQLWIKTAGASDASFVVAQPQSYGFAMRAWELSGAHTVERSATAQEGSAAFTLPTFASAPSTGDTVFYMGNINVSIDNPPLPPTGPGFGSYDFSCYCAHGYKSTLFTWFLTSTYNATNPVPTPWVDFSNEPSNNGQYAFAAIAIK